MNERLSQEKLYKQLYPYYFALCKKYLPNKHDALTALNNGMLKMFKNIDKYDCSLGDFFTWGYSIVRYSALSLIREKISQVQFEELSSQVADQISSADTLDDQRKEFLWNLMQQLPLATRTICMLFYYEEYKIKEIVNELSISEGTVKWHLNQGRMTLKLLKEKMYHYE